MDKNTIWGFVLIGVVIFGFTWYQSRQYTKQVEAQMRADSIARANAPAVDSSAVASADTLAIEDSLGLAASKAALPAYKDSLLASSYAGEEKFYMLSNDKVKIAFTSKGAQPYSAQILGYHYYKDSTDLYLFKPGQSELGYSLYAGEQINTKDFVFDVVEHSDSLLVMRLPFEGGGYIEQRYSLKPDSYMIDNVMSFIGMDKVIPKNVFGYDMDWKVTIPRMEKGYKNESQYSKLDYYFDGEKKPGEIGRGRSGSKRIQTRLSWFAFQQQFFSIIVRSEEEFSSGNLEINFLPEDDPNRSLMTCEASMSNEFQLSDQIVRHNELYFGPNSFHRLKALGHKYEKIIPLGGWMVGWFTRYVIIPAFDLLSRHIANFGIIILLMTIMIKIVVLPFAYKSYSSSAKMQVLKPEIDKLNEKYPKAEDAMKKQQEQMQLYQRAGISPMGGCLPMLLQFPILWAMFRFFPASIELRQQGFLWAEDLSAYDSIWDFGTRIPILGDHISLFALLMAISMFLYTKVVSGQQMSGNDPNAQMMKFMSLYMMPVMMYFICNSLSSGLSYYYLISNILTMVETFIIKKFFVHPEDILARLKATEGKKAPKSKWQQRLEEAQKMQRKALEEQRKKRGY